MKKLIILLLTFTMCGCNHVLFDEPFIVEVIKTVDYNYANGVTSECFYYSNTEGGISGISIKAPCGAYQIGDTIKLQP